MIIRDFYCVHCGRIHPDRIVEIDATEGRGCVTCGADAVLKAVCNGGRNSRYRFADWTEEAVSDHMQYKGVGAATYDKEGNEHPILEADGSEAIKGEYFQPDATSERKARWRHKADVQRGRNKIFIDSKKNP